MNEAVSPQAKPTAPYWQIFPTCAAMIVGDWRFVLSIYPLLIITSLLALDLPAVTPVSAFTVALCERVMQLLFTFLVATRWIRRFSSGPRRISARVMGRFFLVGVGLWLMFSVPSGMLMRTGSPFLSTLALMLIGAAAWITIAWYFYPLPVLLDRGSLRESLTLSRQISVEDPLLPLRLMVAPIGFLSLALAAVMSFSPDGREAWVAYGAAAVSGVFWVFATYLALATALLRLDDTVWREENLDPYRTARLSTLEFQGSSWLARQLRPSHGFGWFAVSLLVWAGNVLRLLTIPPAASITVTEIHISGSSVTLRLHLTDEQYRFRGIQPLYFALAGDQRAVIAPRPDSAQVGQSEESALLSLPRDNTELDLTLTFTASRSGAELQALTDLHLWYGNNKIALLDMSQAKLE